MESNKNIQNNQNQEDIIEIEVKKSPVQE